jgi:hypothetical protein
MKRFFAWRRRYQKFDREWTTHAVVGEFIARLANVWKDEDPQATLCLQPSRCVLE